MVVGRVRRRFFRVGGATQSRTEVAADVVVPTRQAKRAGAALAQAAALIGGAELSVGEAGAAPGEQGRRPRRATT